MITLLNRFSWTHYATSYIGGPHWLRSWPIRTPPSPLPDIDQVRFNAAKMFRNIGDDDQLFQQLVALFLKRHQMMLAEVKQGLDNDDAVTVERAAHSLKGTAGNLCAPAVVLAASRLEAIGHLGTLQDAPPVYAQLETEVLRLVRILARYRQGYEPTSKAA